MARLGYTGMGLVGTTLPPATRLSAPLRKGASVFLSKGENCVCQARRGHAANLDGKTSCFRCQSVLSSQRNFSLRKVKVEEVALRACLMLCPASRDKGVTSSSNPSSPDSGTSEESIKTEQFKSVSKSESEEPLLLQLPTSADALNWFCISLILLVCLTDFTPLGASIKTSPSAPLILAAVQWAFFVGPTVAWARDSRFDLLDTFKLKPCSPRDLGTGALGGVACWAFVWALTSLKNGGLDAGSLTMPFTTFASVTPWDLLWYALSPAMAEELLFRGFLLTALSHSFGRVDRVMLAAGMFGGFHLSLSQLFPTTVLGIAAGFATVASGSVLPAVALHFAHNAAALLLGGLGNTTPFGA